MSADFRPILEIERLIHEPARLVIMALLYTVESADFLFLLQETGLTKGNLSSHLAKLEQAGYVTVRKTFKGKFPYTLYQQTDTGRAAFQAYQNGLRRILEATDDNSQD